MKHLNLNRLSNVCGLQLKPVSPIAYSLAIIDNLMPGMDGEELGRKIKQNEALRNIPLVLLTSAAVRGTSSVFKEIVYSAYITKPILSDLLYETLTRVLGLADNETNNELFLTRHTVMEDEFNFHNHNVELTGKILLVEDVLVNQKVALGLMESLHLQVDLAENGSLALEKLKHNQYDLILMDCQMPVMDGFEATRIIRENDQDIIIIAVTANALASDRKNCLEAGMNDYLAKPFNRKQLSRILQKWLGNGEQSLIIEENNVSDSNNTREVLDQEKLQEMKSVMGTVFDQLIPAYVEQSDDMVHGMMARLEAKDITTLERYAHSMKSSSHNVGGVHLSKISAELEDMCRANESSDDEIAIKIQTVCDEYEQVKVSLLDYQERSK